MNTKTYSSQWGHPASGVWSLRIFTLILLISLLRGEGHASPPVEGEPVWGRKPVLAYFVLTPSLAETFQAGAGLSLTEFETVQEIAQQETAQLHQLEQTTQLIIEDDSLTQAEKQARIAQTGYNDAVSQTLTVTQQKLETALPEATLNRMIAWIEQQWAQERIMHGTMGLPVSRALTSARTYSIFATHFDSSGSYAVALPDKCVKFSDNGNSSCAGSGYSTGNYTIQLTYDDTVSIQSFDSGPWNVDDNFWSTLADPHPRRLYTDLPVGMPEAQAAYFDDYNGGRDQYDRTVTAPFAIDLGDGVGSDIGLNPGSNDWVEVTFNWTDGWDAWNAEVVTLLKPTNLEPPYTGDMCVTAWYRFYPDLTDGGKAAYLTLNVNDPSQSTNSAEWIPDIPVAGDYIVRAFVPNHGPIDWLCPNKTINFDTSDAEYIIHHANGQTTVSKNQGPMANQYLDLGTYEFDAGADGRVELADLNDEESLSHTVAFSAMQFRQVVDPPTPSPTPSPTFTPTPTPTPTPTLPPDPIVYTESRIVAPESNVDIQVYAGNLQLPGLGQAIVDVQFDPGVVDAVTCQPDPGGVFDSESCLPDFDADGVFPDTARVTLTSAGGVPGNPTLATLTFQAVGAPSTYSWLDLVLVQFLQLGGTEIPAKAGKGMVCITPCENMWLLPLIFK